MKNIFFFLLFFISFFSICFGQNKLQNQTNKLFNDTLFFKNDQIKLVKISNISHTTITFYSIKSNYKQTIEKSKLKKVVFMSNGNIHNELNLELSEIYNDTLYLKNNQIKLVKICNESKNTITFYSIASKHKQTIEKTKLKGAGYLGNIYSVGTTELINLPKRYFDTLFLKNNEIKFVQLTNISKNKITYFSTKSIHKETVSASQVSKIGFRSVSIYPKRSVSSSSLEKYGDTLFLRNKMILKVKLIELNDNYLKFNTLQSNNDSVSKDDVEKVHLLNGKKSAICYLKIGEIKNNLDFIYSDSINTNADINIFRNRYIDRTIDLNKINEPLFGFCKQCTFLYHPSFGVNIAINKVYNTGILNNSIRYKDILPNVNFLNGTFFFNKKIGIDFQINFNHQSKNESFENYLHHSYPDYYILNSSNSTYNENHKLAEQLFTGICYMKHKRNVSLYYKLLVGISSLNHSNGSAILKEKNSNFIHTIKIDLKDDDSMSNYMTYASSITIGYNIAKNFQITLTSLGSYFKYEYSYLKSMTNHYTNTTTNELIHRKGEMLVYAINIGLLINFRSLFNLD